MKTRPYPNRLFLPAFLTILAFFALASVHCTLTVGAAHEHGVDRLWVVTVSAVLLVILCTNLVGGWLGYASAGTSDRHDRMVVTVALVATPILLSTVVLFVGSSVAAGVPADALPIPVPFALRDWRGSSVQGEGASIPVVTGTVVGAPSGPPAGFPKARRTHSRFASTVAEAPDAKSASTWTSPTASITTSERTGVASPHRHPSNGTTHAHASSSMVDSARATSRSVPRPISSTRPSRSNVPCGSSTKIASSGHSSRTATPSSSVPFVDDPVIGRPPSW